MNDIVEKIGNSTIQHGKYNNRIYLMKLDPGDCWVMPKKLDSLADENGYTKIFAKVPLSICAQFQKLGFTKEAFIPGFYTGSTPAYFMSKFIDKQRMILPNKIKNELSEIISLAKSKRKATIEDLPDDYKIRKLTNDDITQLTELYKAVFETYPFPIFDPDYIKETMQDHIIYYGLFQGDKLLSASSCETDRENLNVEMTDFATHPDHLGNGFAVQLLRVMDKEMTSQGFLTAFTIARSASHGMNITFAKCGYEFAGMLVNNTNINGSIESMNVWFKSLEK